MTKDPRICWHKKLRIHKNLDMKYCYCGECGERLSIVELINRAMRILEKLEDFLDKANSKPRTYKSPEPKGEFS